MPSQAGSPAAPHAAAPPHAWRLEIFRREDGLDSEARAAEAELAELGLEHLRLRHGRGFLLSPAFTREQAEAVAADLLVDPVVDRARLIAPGESAGDAGGAHRVLVAPQPGVMDPVARSLGELLERAGPRPADSGDGQPAIGTYRIWEVFGGAADAELELLARKLFANETVDTVRVDREDLPFRRPAGAGRRGRVEVPLLEAEPEALDRLSSEGQLSLNRVEMLAIQAHYRELGREPSACELETIAQTWSEHCKHKTLTGIVEFEGERIDNLLKSTIARATRELAREDFCLSVFVDNAGIVALDDTWALAIKVETHNHPSAIDPYGGAGTGIGGVIRDILGAGLGAKPIANIDAFFVGPLDMQAADVPKGSLHPRRILRGVVAGVRDYGNRMGIPTVCGGLWFHPGYTANPLVYAGTVGLMPRTAVDKRVAPGDWVVAVGGRTGRDGIHGATFSSIELSETSEVDSSHAVQIGDPITEKGVLDCLLEARERGLYRGVTDCGAGGFSSAVGEMAAECGADVWLHEVPLKYPGLASHEIWISEAQERMVLAVPPEHLDQLLALFASEEVLAAVIGRFRSDGQLVLLDGDEEVGRLDGHFLHEGTPRPVRQARWTPPTGTPAGVPALADPAAEILAALAHPNVTSREWILRQYDHEVQGMAVVKPLVGVRGDGPGDGAVLQPLPDRVVGFALGVGASATRGALDPYAMALSGIDEALRAVVAVGADPGRAALLDNFSWGNCDDPENLGALVLAARACYDAALAFRAPFVSGKDSLNNQYRVGDRRLSIPHTLLITALGIVPDVSRAMTMDLAEAGNTLYLVGRTRAELGGSVWLEQRGRGFEQGFVAPVPRPDLEEAPRLFAALHGAIAAGDVRSCHDLSEGGLAVALAESCFAGDLGAELDLSRVPVEGAEGSSSHDALALFSESCTRFLVEVAPAHRAAFEARFAGLPLAEVGRVSDDKHLSVRGANGALLARIPSDQLRAAHRGDFRG